MFLVRVSKPVFSHIEEEAMSLSVFSYCICIFLQVTVAFSTHLCVVCHHFCCPMSLFQSNVTSDNLPKGLHLGMEKAQSAFDEKNCLTLL